MAGDDIGLQSSCFWKILTQFRSPCMLFLSKSVWLSNHWPSVSNNGSNKIMIQHVLYTLRLRKYVDNRSGLSKYTTDRKYKLHVNITMLRAPEMKIIFMADNFNYITNINLIPSFIYRCVFKLLSKQILFMTVAFSVHYPSLEPLWVTDHNTNNNTKWLNAS